LDGLPGILRVKRSQLPVPRPSATLSAVSLVALVAVVIAAGALQYRWIGEASDAQEARTLARVRESVEQVAHALDAEIARAVLVFTRPDGARGATGDTIERAWAAWNAGASWPHLVSGVTLLQSNGNAWQTRTWGEAHAVEPSSVVDSSGLGPSQSSATNDGAVRVFARTRAIFLDGEPSVIGPLPGSPEGPPQINWIAVRFDRGYATANVFPQLLELHSTPDDRRAFEFELRPATDTAPGAVIVADQFSYRPDCFLGQSDPAGMTVLTFRGAGRGPGRSRGVVFHTDGPAGLSLPALLRAVGHCPSSAPHSDRSLMRIAVRKTASATTDVFATYRRRNILMSAVVLVALTAALSAVVLSTERARRLVRLQTVVAAGISHELRTPLASLSVVADHLKNGHVENVEQARRYGEIIGAQSRRLRHIVDQTLALTGLTEGSRTVNRRSAEVAEVIDAAIAGMAASASAAGVTIESHIEAATPPVSVDVDLVVLCLTNLIENALKYASSGRWIGISARPSAGSRSIVELAVEDRGEGIDAGEAAAAFEPFYRGSAARRSRQSGIGLGLAIVRSAVEAHEGRIEIDHAVPQGCRIRMFLPSAEPPDAVPVAMQER
jgi:signal transduction histidine kinase